MTNTNLTQTNFESTIVDNPSNRTRTLSTPRSTLKPNRSSPRSLVSNRFRRSWHLVYSQPGALPAAALEDLITRVKALNTDQVRAKITARKTAASS
jgi:hypothetical protein